MRKLTYTSAIRAALALSIAGTLQADNRIVFSLVAPPPAATDELIAQDQAQQTEAIGKKVASMAQHTPAENALRTTKYAIKSLIRPKLSGFMAMYGGYCEISNHDGTISLPLRHTTPKLYVAVTPDFTLVKVKDQTFSHTEYKPGVPTILYQFDRIKDQANMVYWNVKTIPLPTDNTINPLTVILVTKPSNLYIPVGKFLAAESTHLVIPDIYVVGSIDNEDTLLRALDHKIYFESIQVNEKKASDVISQSIVPNL
ncbi:MAG: hypothetical protein WCT20_03935 [Candidatus Babeliales bacterium]